jgi:hypothetical protein
VSVNVNANVTAQVGLAVNDYARADISGQNSAAAYTTVANSTPGWATVAGGTPPPSIPAGFTTFTINQWDSTGGAAADKQVCFALVGGMGHVVPAFGPAAVVEFLLAWGGL